MSMLLFLNLSSKSQTTIYLFPGQGSDYRIFDSITFDSLYKVKVIAYSTPAKGATMAAFAKSLSSQIDTSEDFILIGVSLGGMLCVELSEFLNPRQTIIVSSAKNRKELPFRYRFQKVIPIYEAIPPKALFIGAKILQPLVEPDRNKNKDVFKSMLESKEPVYIKRTIRLIIQWDRTHNTKTIFQIHGTNDHTIPIRNIKTPTYVIDGGSHMMTLTRSQAMSKILNNLVSNASCYD